MIINTYIPSPSLQPFIKRYLVIESKEAVTNRVLPDTSLAIAFRYKGKVSYVNDDSYHQLPSTIVSGLRRSARFIHYAPHSANLIALFTESGASAFFREPIYELFEKSISLGHFTTTTTSQTSMIEEQLAEATNNQQRIAIVEQFLRSRLFYKKQDELILSALRIIKQDKGNVRIKAVAGSLYISQDAFEKRFRNAVGTTPKQFASIIRLRAIINQKDSYQILAHTAFEAGYYDQSHFSKDFLLFTAQTPADFFASVQPFW